MGRENYHWSCIYEVGKTGIKVRFKMRETYCKICDNLASLPGIVDFPFGNPSDI